MIGVLEQQSGPVRKGTSSASFAQRSRAQSAVFDDDNLVSPAGLVPVMEPGRADRPVGAAGREGHTSANRGQVGVGEPGAETRHADRGDVRGRGQHRRSGRDPLRWDDDPVRRGLAPSTLGTCCGSSPSAMPASWSRCCAGITGRPCANARSAARRRARAFIDIDSLLRPVYGHAKQGACFGHTKIAGKQVLRKGLSPLAATISTEPRRR